MADLEDTILKQNIPGRWSTFERERGRDHREHADCCEDEDECAPASDEAPRSEEEALMDLARNLAYDDVPEPVRQSILAQRMRGPSTGVKGVLADYRADKALAEAQREAEANFRSAVLRRIAVGASSSVPEEQGPEEEEEDAFFREFRMKRLLGASVALQASA